MDARKVLGLAAAGGVLMGTLAGVALPTRMHFAALRPWQDSSHAHPVDPVTEPTPVTVAALEPTLADSMTAPAGFTAPVPPPPAYAPERMAWHTVRHRADDLGDPPPPPPEAEPPDGADNSEPGGYPPRDDGSGDDAG